MEHRVIEARRPWSDRPSDANKQPIDMDSDKYSRRYGRAIIELREALKDGKTHHRDEAVVIANKHRVPVQALCDRAGVYCFYTEVMDRREIEQDTGHDGNGELLTENSRYRAECDLDGYDRLRDEQVVDNLWYRIANEGRE